MNEIVFKPKHNWFSIGFLGFIIALLGGAFAIGGFALNNLFLIILGCVLVLFGFVSVAGRSRLIIVRDTEVVMKRLLFPAIVLKYENFTDFNGEMFIFGNRGISLHGMTNAKEFVDIFLPTLEKRNIQPTGKYVADISRTNKAFRCSVVPSFLISLVITYIVKVYFGVQIDGRIVGVIVFLIILFGAYFILKRKEEME